MVKAAVTASLACALGCSSGDGGLVDRGAPDDGGSVDGGEPDAGPLPAPFASRFRRFALEDDFFAEGAAFGDFDRNGATDVVAGPFWYEGPAFDVRHELREPVAFDPYGYSNSFFAFVYDFDADGWDDVLFIGFPGQDATWYENPGPLEQTRWPAHRVFDVVDNESPWFSDLTGDARPELILSFEGRFGWAEPDWATPTAPWTFHPLSETGPWGRFTHGLGVGDLNGDGRADVLDAEGWWEQPQSLAGDPVWTRHPQPFGTGGAQMIVDDVDGDGDADVVTTLAAHGYGVSWFEQHEEAGERRFREHRISGSPGDEGPTAVALHEPHALTLHDMNGDGARDIVTGERFWGHVPEGDPDFAAPALLVWFEHQRHAGAVSFAPHVVDDASGVGTQVVAADADGDGLGDIVVASKKGVHVFLHERE